MKWTASLELGISWYYLWFISVRKQLVRKKLGESVPLNNCAIGRVRVPLIMLRGVMEFRLRYGISYGRLSFFYSSLIGDKPGLGVSLFITASLARFLRRSLRRSDCWEISAYQTHNFGPQDLTTLRSCRFIEFLYSSIQTGSEFWTMICYWNKFQLVCTAKSINNLKKNF